MTDQPEQEVLAETTIRERSRSPRRDIAEGKVGDSPNLNKSPNSLIEKLAGTRQPRVLSIPQECVGKILGKHGETVVKLRQQTNTEIAINQDTRAKGFSICTITGPSDEACAEAQVAIEQLMQEHLISQQEQQKNMKEVKVPQQFVGLIIGKGGATIIKVKKHTGADVVMSQEKASDGFSIAQVSGESIEVVNGAVEIIEKMIESGRLAQDGDTHGAPGMKMEKLPGLEFLTEGEPNTPNGGEFGVMPTKGYSSKGTMDKGLGKGGVGPYSKNTPLQPDELCDTFDVPRKYLGLLIGKNGEAIKRFREQGYAKGLKIHVDQDGQEAGGVVKIVGKDWNAITMLKSEIQQNLFKAIGYLEAGGAQATTNTPTSSSKDYWNKDKNGKGGDKSSKGGYGKGKGDNSWGKDGKDSSKGWGKDSKDTGKGWGKSDGGKGSYGSNDNSWGGYSDNSWSDKGKSKGGKAFGGNNNNGGAEQDETRWWAQVFSEVLQAQSAPAPPKKEDPLEALMNQLSAGGGQQQQQHSNTGWGGQQQSNNDWSNNDWNSTGGWNQGSGNSGGNDSSDLTAALQQLLGGGGGSSW